MNIRIGQLQLNQFRACDARELYCIRNHPSVRRFMTKPQLIPYHSHRAWVENSLLADESFLLFLVRFAGDKRAAGLSQLKIGAEGAEIGVIFRQPNEHQTAIAVTTVAMLHLAFEKLRLNWVISYVLSSHRTAIKFNKHFGAVEDQSDRPGMVKLKLSPELCLANKIYQRVMRRIHRQGFSLNL